MTLPRTDGSRALPKTSWSRRSRLRTPGGEGTHLYVRRSRRRASRRTRPCARSPEGARHRDAGRRHRRHEGQSCRDDAVGFRPSAAKRSHARRASEGPRPRRDPRSRRETPRKQAQDGHLRGQSLRPRRARRAARGDRQHPRRDRTFRERGCPRYRTPSASSASAENGDNAERARAWLGGKERAPKRAAASGASTSLRFSRRCSTRCSTRASKTAPGGRRFSATCSRRKTPAALFSCAPTSGGGPAPRGAWRNCARPDLMFGDRMRSPEVAAAKLEQRRRSSALPRGDVDLLLARIARRGHAARATAPRDGMAVAVLNSQRGSRR